MVSIRKAQQGFHLRNRRGMNYSQAEKEKLGLVVAGVCIGVLIIVFWNSSGGGGSGGSGGGGGFGFGLTRNGGMIPDHLRSINYKKHPKLQVESKPMSDSFNALAMDILESLDCANLFNKTTSRRRLDEQHADDGGFDNHGDGDDDGDDDGDGDDTPDEEEKWGRRADGGNNNAAWNDINNNNNNNNNEWGDDVNNMNGYSGDGDDNYMAMTGKHLFCLAAMQTPPAEDIVSQLQCDATNTKRQTLLDLWSAARSQMPKELMVQVLGLARESASQTLLGHTLPSLWAPQDDAGLQYLLNTLNSDNDVENGGLRGLQGSLGPNKLFVDVGSCLGMTTLAVNFQYPGTKIISVEPAAPNWLLQQINFRCNLDHEQFSKHIKVVMAGVGPNTEDEDNMMAKLMWRPMATTSTRAWTPSAEHQSDDVELVVRLRKLRSILAEADVFDNRIDVLNVDCEGCEYNLIPALGEEEFDAIPTIMGSAHWGYIPTKKLPSSKRGKITHERMCSHENIAKDTKECCAFPDLKVKSSVPGEALVREHKSGGFPPIDSTVSDVIQEGLCDGFDSWAAEHYLNDVKDDWGWLELTSQA